MRGVYTDIDDTLTRGGAVERCALEALHALHDRGLPVIAITGRPHGWSEGWLRKLPIDAIVAENGAVALLRNGHDVVTEFAQDAVTRSANARRLAAAADRVLREVPGTTLARDSAGRITDIAVDHAEFAALDAATIARVVAVLEAEAMNVTVSSIHVNAWFGDHDKLTAARWMQQRLFGRALDDAETARWVYVGDSTNDQALFAHFPLSVGVANLQRFASLLTTWPAYVTAGERGDGFAEVASRLLAARR